MGWIIWTIILAIPFWIGVGMVAFGSWPESDDEAIRRAPPAVGKLGTRVPGIILVTIVAVWWTLLTGFAAGHTLGTGQAALIYDFSGKLDSKRTTPGVIWTFPWQHVTKVNTFLRSETFELGPSNSAVSKDQQSIFALIGLNYEVDADGILNLYTTVGPDWERKLIDARLLQDFKEVTSKYSAQEITTKREQLRRETRDRLKTEFLKYPAISIQDFFVKNLHYSDDYERSISAKNVQVQKALEARAKVQESKAEASQKVATAQGEARATVLRAQADAKALSLKGQAIRKNPEVLRLEAIEKLNPAADVIICTGTGDGNCPAFLPARTGGK